MEKNAQCGWQEAWVKRLSVKVLVTGGDGRRTSRECTTQQEIFDAASPVPADRFSGAFSLSYYRGRLFGNLGFVGNSECGQQVLEGTYIFPEGMDPAKDTTLRML